MALLKWITSPARPQVRPWGQLSTLAWLSVALLGAAGFAGAAQANEPVVQTAASQLVFVHPVLGNDASGDGSPRSPFRTITRAAQSVSPNTVILLAAGTYAAANGEQFPILLPPGVAVQADPSTGGEGVVIQGQIAQGGGGVSPAAPELAPIPRHPSTAVTPSTAAAPASRTTISAEVVDEPSAVPFPFAAEGAGFVPIMPTGDFPASSGLNTRRSAAGRTFGQAAGRRFRDGSLRESPTSSVQPPVPAAAQPVSQPIPVQGIPISVSPPASVGSVGSQSQVGVAPDGLPYQPISSTTFAAPAAPVRRPVVQRAFRPLPQRSSLGGAVALSPTRQEPVASFQGAIEIPVPPPERSGSAPVRRPASDLRYERPVVARRSPVAAQPASQYSQYTLLPVPDPNAPIGNVSGVPSVPVSGVRPRPTTPVASRASELGLRYRVVVRAADAALQDRVLSVFPGAFLTYDRRQSVVMQVGAFNDEANAQEVVDILRQNGIRAQVERVD